MTIFAVAEKIRNEDASGASGVQPKIQNVKLRFYILAAIAACIASYACDSYVQSYIATAGPLCETFSNDILTDEDTDTDRYVDYNFAFCAPSGANISAPRTSSPNSIPRNWSECKRCPETDNPFITIKSGKVTGISALNSFLSVISLYPSGLFSESHRFIHFCRLTI